MKEALIRKKAIKELEEKGWLTWFAPKVKFKKTDIFGIIDLLAIKGRQRKQIQLTTISNLSTRRKKIVQFLKENKIEMTIEIWAWSKKTKSFKKEKVNHKTKI